MASRLKDNFYACMATSQDADETDGQYRYFLNQLELNHDQ